MKVKAIIIYLAVLSFCIYAQNNTADINDFSFFGFKFNYSMEDVKKELTRQKKEFKIIKDHYITDESIKYETIAYKDWKGADYNDATEDVKDKFIFVFYNNELYSIAMIQVSKNDYEKMLTDLNNNFKSIIETEEDSNTKVLYINNSIKALINPVVFVDRNNFLFLNINMGKKLMKEIKKGESPNRIYYKTKIPELALREVPKMDGKIIYNISKNDEFLISPENLTYIDKDGKLKKKPEREEETIEGIKGKWIIASICNFVTGWVFDGFINPVDKASKPVRYITKADNLRLRDTPTQDGKIIRNLKKSEKLELIEKGKEETIGGIKGNWVKVKTEKSEVGWCFDGYLEEVK